MRAALLLVLVGCASAPPADVDETCAVSDVYVHDSTTKDTGPITVERGGTMVCLIVDNFDMPGAHLMVTTDAESGTQSSFTASVLLDYNHHLALLAEGADVTTGDAFPRTSQTLEWDMPSNLAVGERYVLYARDAAATTSVHFSLFVPN